MSIDAKAWLSISSVSFTGYKSGSGSSSVSAVSPRRYEAILIMLDMLLGLPDRESVYPGLHPNRGVASVATEDVNE